MPTLEERLRGLLLVLRSPQFTDDSIQQLAERFIATVEENFLDLPEPVRKAMRQSYVMGAEQAVTLVSGLMQEMLARHDVDLALADKEAV